MALGETDQIFSSSITYTGIFSFKDFYKFCYDWLQEETQLNIFSEDKYKEKLAGDEKEIKVEWTGKRKVTDYFMFEVKVTFLIRNLKEVEIMKNNTKVKTNQGWIRVSVKGNLIRDYEGKFERTAIKKFLRSIYEKWIIRSRIDQMEDKLGSDCDEFLSQAKAYLALEGKKKILEK